MGSGVVITPKVRAHPEEFVKTILVIVQTQVEAARIEHKLIGDRWDTDDLCLNQCAGGGNPMLGRKHSKESRLLMSASQSGRKHTEESRKKISLSQKGKVTSAETREKMSKAMTGISHGFGNTNSLGHQHTPESRAKISKSQTGRRHSEETKRKIGESQKGRLGGFAGRKHTSETKARMSEAARVRHAKKSHD